MYLPVLLQTRCLAIVFCSLITIGNQANADTPSTPPSQQQQQQQFHQNAQNQPYSTYKPTQNSNPSSKLPTQQQQQHQQQQQQQSQQQQHHGNSYTMLSQAMSQAVSHEFSKWSYKRNNKINEKKYMCANTHTFENHIRFICSISTLHLAELSLLSPCLCVQLVITICVCVCVSMYFITNEDMQAQACVHGLWISVCITQTLKTIEIGCKRMKTYQ